MNMERFVQPTGNQELLPCMLTQTQRRLKNIGRNNMLKTEEQSKYKEQLI